MKDSEKFDLIVAAVLSFVCAYLGYLLFTLLI